MSHQPVGPVVADTTARELPEREILKGEFVELHRVDPARHAEELFNASHGDAERLSIWTYIPMAGPFDSIADMQNWLQRCRERDDFFFFAVYDRAKNEYVGMTSFAAMVPEMHRLELAFIWYAPDSQRSKINTESIYIMFCEAFDRLNYRRVEWKCDALNQPSRNAALRLGFQFEGIFRQHLIVHGRNRDTAWFSVLDSEWPQIKENIRDWLYSEAEYFSLGERNQLNRPAS